MLLLVQTTHCPYSPGIRLARLEDNKYKPRSQSSKRKNLSTRSDPRWSWVIPNAQWGDVYDTGYVCRCSRHLQCILGYPNPLVLRLCRWWVRISEYGSSDNRNYPKYKYQHHHYTFSVLLALALAWILLVWRKQVTYRRLKYRSHYKMATIL